MERATPNEPFSLHEDRQITLGFEGETPEFEEGASVSGSADILVDWFPSPTLRLECQLDKPPISLIAGETTPTLTLEVDGFSEPLTDLLATRVEIGSDGNQVALRLSSTPQRVHLSGECKYAVGHLVNFPRLLNGGFDLEAEGWRLSIRSAFSNPKASHKLLKRTSGFGFTHVVILTILDQKSFHPNRARLLIEPLRLFLSFCAGQWCAPAFMSAFDDERLTWQEWGFGQSKPYRSARGNWLGKFDSESPPEIFPTFIRRYRQGEWRKTISDSIYWYLLANSNDTNIDAGIILAQSALELLGWTGLTQATNTLTEDNFESLSAAEQLRRTLHEARIPASVPSLLGELKSVGDQLQIDGPKLFTEMRNSLVHPGQKRIEQHKGGRVTFECYTLGMWYIELLLLRLFDFEGQYANRCNYDGFRGETSTVPWSDSGND